MRTWRICSAQAGTAGNGACGSAAAASVNCKASPNASQTACNCWALVCKAGGNFASTLDHCASSVRLLACACQRSKSACKASRCAWASCQGLVERTSMRCANKTAASRWTCDWCCRSSMALTRSANAVLRPARGSRDNGAPALAASRCHAMASAMLMRDASRSAAPFSAQLWANASCSMLRRFSSMLSRKTLDAPLSRWLISLKTSCKAGKLGSVSNHVCKTWMRSPEVAAVKAPPVNASRAERSGVLFSGWVTLTAQYLNIPTLSLRL